MTYLNYANVGDVIGRNLVTKPKFFDADKGAWTAGTSDLRTTSIGDRYRLGGFSRTSIKIADTFVPGETYDVTIQGMVAGTATAYAYLTSRADSTALPGSLQKSAERVTITGTDYAGVHTATITTPAGQPGSDTGLWLQVETSTSGQCGFIAARVDDDGSTVTGVLDGDTADDADRAFAWDGTANASTTTVTALTAFGTPPDPDPDPEPDPEPTLPETLGRDVAAFLDGADDPDLVALATEHSAVMTALVRAYTRGRGFGSDGTPLDDVRAVIVTATARLVANPEQTDNYAGGAGVRGGFTGFSLTEQVVLNTYRRRSA